MARYELETQVDADTEEAQGQFQEIAQTFDAVPRRLLTIRISSLTQSEASQTQPCVRP